MAHGMASLFGVSGLLSESTMRSPLGLTLGVILLDITGVLLVILPAQYYTSSQCNSTGSYTSMYSSTCRAQTVIDSPFLVRLVTVAAAVSGFLGAIMTAISTYRLVEA